MPLNPSREILERQWELLRLLPAKRPGKTARQLTEELATRGYQVVKRTVERDLRVLSTVFPLHCNDAGVPHGWYWQEGAAADIPGVTLAEALSLHLVRETLRPLLPAAVLETLEPRFRQAEEKLTGARRNSPLARWKDKVRSIPPALPLHPPDIDRAVLDSLQSALLHQVQVEVDYRAMHDPEPKTLTLHPLGLVQRGPVIYLVATAFSYEDIRLYAVHRITRAEELPQKATRPPDFDLDEYIRGGALQFGNGQPISLKALVDSGLARILSESPLSEDQELEQQGAGYRLRATVSDTWQLRWWLLSQGSSIEVLGPKALRSEIVDSLQRALDPYQDEG